MTYTATSFPGEPRAAPSGYSYFLPGDIHLAGNIAMPASILKQLESAGLALGAFSSLIERIPNPTMFIHAYTGREATLSSLIEGTQAKISDAFKKEEQVEPEKRDDWAEIAAYIAALEEAIAGLEELPLCNRLIKTAHKTLLSQNRGKHKLPGEFRSSQNWIGGSRPENAHFVPPAHEHIGELMGQLEKFIHDDNLPIPYLIKAALIHYQFETIHPFLDGNGRVGRMLVPLYLLQNKIINHPILYISDFLEAQRKNYFQALDRARKNEDGTIKWISFFLDAVEQSAKNGIEATQKLLAYDEHLRQQAIPQLGKSTSNGAKVLNFIYKNPFVDAKDLQAKLDFSPQISQHLLRSFVGLGILKETTGKKRNRIYAFEKYLEILEQR